MKFLVILVLFPFVISCSLNGPSSQYRNQKIIQNQETWLNYSYEIMKNKNNSLDDLKIKFGDPLLVAINNGKMQLMYEYNDNGIAKNSIVIVEDGVVISVGFVSN